MNANEFKAQERAKNVAKFGRWASASKRDAADPMKLLFEHAPRNELEALQHGNALANTGNYPVGTSECFNVGISGGCGPECFVYLKGQCGEPQEMLPGLDANGLKLHAELYEPNPEHKENEMWQPIETAPRDATAILVMRDIWPGARSGRAEECNGHNTYVAAWWPGERGGQGAWICYMDAVLDPECPVEPTHWMPLPDPPGAQPTPSVSAELLDRAIDTIGRFCSDEGWMQSDMDTLDALIAAQKAKS